MNCQTEPSPAEKLSLALDVTVKLLEKRSSLKRLLGERYEITINPWVTAIEKACKRTGKGRLEAGLDMMKWHSERYEGMQMLLVAAATVEAIERETGDKK